MACNCGCSPCRCGVNADWRPHFYSADMLNRDARLKAEGAAEATAAIVADLRGFADRHSAMARDYADDGSENMAFTHDTMAMGYRIAADRYERGAHLAGAGTATRNNEGE